MVLCKYLIRGETLIKSKRVVTILSLFLAILACSVFVLSADFFNINEVQNKNIRAIESSNEKFSSNSPRAFAATQDKVVLSTSSVQSTIKQKQVYSVAKNPKNSKWVNTTNSNDNNKHPEKKFRWAYDTYSTTTTYYTNISTNASFPKNAKVTFTSSKDATVVVKTKISSKYENIANPYISPCQSCQVFNPTLQKIAKSLSKGKTDKAAADRILAYVQKRIVYEGYSNTKYGAYETWKLKRGNCVDSSHLTVALLRAAKIPAIYADKGVYDQFGHCWPMAYVPYKGKNQWLPGEATLISGKATKYSITAPFSPTALNWFTVDQFQYIKADYSERMVVYIW